MEACSSSHCWGREIARLGHEVRPPVKRQKNDAANAEAEAASRPMIVAVKQQQSHGWRSLFVRQRTALRGHLAEFGLVASQGTANVRKLEEALLASPDLPDLMHQIAADLLKQRLNEKIGEIDSRIKALAEEDEDAKRLGGQFLDCFGSLRAPDGELPVGARLRGLTDAKRGQHGGETRPGHQKLWRVIGAMSAVR